MEIELTKGQRTLIDDEDVERASKHSWCVLDLRSRRNGLMYAVSSINRKFVYLHRFILHARSKTIVDHINGNGLDNRKQNLRITTRSRNSLNRRGLASNNTTGVNGVFWEKRRKKYRAEIKVDGKVHFVGYFTDIRKAELAREAIKNNLIKKETTR